MPIMSLVDWKKRTGGYRSMLLRRVDDALEAYHTPDANEVKEKRRLKVAFDSWQASKEGPSGRGEVAIAAIAEMRESLEPYKPPTPSWTAPPIPKKPTDKSIYLASSFENANSLERDQSPKAFEAARELINKIFLRLNQAKAAGDDRYIY
jgi:hypothetical protein